MMQTRDVIGETEDLLRTKASPSDLAWAKADLSAYYSFVCAGLEDIYTQKAKNWLLLRETVKSDASADRLWEATPEGVNEVGLKLRLKRMDKLFSAISSLLKVAEGEAKMQW